MLFQLKFNLVCFLYLILLLFSYCKFLIMMTTCQQLIVMEKQLIRLQINKGRLKKRVTFFHAIIFIIVNDFVKPCSVTSMHINSSCYLTFFSSNSKMEVPLLNDPLSNFGISFGSSTSLGACLSISPKYLFGARVPVKHWRVFLTHSVQPLSKKLS